MAEQRYTPALPRRDGASGTATRRHDARRYTPQQHTPYRYAVTASRRTRVRHTATQRYGSREHTALSAARLSPAAQSYVARRDDRRRSYTSSARLRPDAAVRRMSKYGAGAGTGDHKNAVGMQWQQINVRRAQYTVAITIQGKRLRQNEAAGQAV
ncbi:hypothetical protein TNCT_586201 [Trichonephila clavata]|uniref:Uncharacterized protein n=1 Tax=Trichonephila clavata TaxID=2740835 RepID=A0A8X6KQD4_TRICU|nr:hypothetical protein TNCT_586201 [Trichonephila clavata]